MERRPLGRSGLDISVVGAGGWQAGGVWSVAGVAFGWSGQRDRDSLDALRRALELGVSWIDTSPVYGLERSEKLIGSLVAAAPEPPLVFTKCGPQVRNDVLSFSLRADVVRAQVEGSLRRLGLEALDLVQIHWPLPDEEIEEGWSTLAQLKREGKVKHIGVSNFSLAQLERCQAIAPVESLQSSYSLLDRALELEILPHCAGEAIGVIAYGPLAHGLLTGTWTRERVEALPEDDFRFANNQHFARPIVYENLRRVEQLKRVAAEEGRAALEVTLAWTLRNPAVTAAIVGFRRPEQVDGVVAATRLVLSQHALAELDAAFPTGA